MSLLCYQKPYSNLMLFAALLLLCGFASMPEQNKNDVYSNSDAYYKHSYVDVSYSRKFGGYKRFVSVDYKLVVNTTKGVEENAFLNLSEYESNHLEQIKVRTLKANGTIINLDSSEVFKKSSSKEKFSSINYPIPAVEPGDTIEAKYVYYENLEQNQMLNYVTLNLELPSKNTQYTIRTKMGKKVRYKTYNGFPEPAIVSSDTLLYLQFSLDDVNALKENDYSCLKCDLPYFYYTLEDKDQEARTWKDVYNEEFNIYTQPLDVDYEKSSYYKRWKRRVIDTEKDSSKYYIFKKIYNEILNTMAIEPAQVDEIIKSNGYFLKNERFDPISIRRLYRQLLEELEIDYWAVFGKTKQYGIIDKDFIRRGEFDHVFFGFEDDKGVINFVYPHDEVFKYQFGELPTSLYETEAMMVKPVYEERQKKRDKFITRDFELNQVDSVKVLRVKLPGMDSDFNYINQVFSAEVDIDSKTTKFRSRFKASGGFSTEIRSFYNMLNENKEMSDYYDAVWEYEGEDNTIQIDTFTNVSLNNEKPFKYTISSEGTINEIVEIVNDSLVSVSLDKLINHNRLDYAQDSSDLNYYLDYSFSDLILFYINFPKPIEVLGIEDSNGKYENDFGQYYIKLNKSQEKQLVIESKYTISKSYIPKQDLESLKQLNENLLNLKNKRLIVKLKD